MNAPESPVEMALQWYMDAALYGFTAQTPDGTRIDPLTIHPICGELQYDRVSGVPYCVRERGHDGPCTGSA